MYASMVSQQVYKISVCIYLAVEEFLFISLKKLLFNTISQRNFSERHSMKTSINNILTYADNDNMVNKKQY